MRNDFPISFIFAQRIIPRTGRTPGRPANRISIPPPPKGCGCAAYSHFGRVLNPPLRFLWGINALFLQNLSSGLVGAASPGGPPYSQQSSFQRRTGRRPRRPTLYATIFPYLFIFLQRIDPRTGRTPGRPAYRITIPPSKKVAAPPRIPILGGFRTRPYGFLGRFFLIFCKIFHQGL